MVLWASFKQKVVARSSTEVEYRVLALVAYEVIWIISILKELHVCPSHTLIILIDSLSDKFLVSNPIMLTRIKYVQINFYFIKELMVDGALDVCFTPSKDQVANALKKVFE